MSNLTSNPAPSSGAKPKIAVILGSTRDTRYCPVPGAWILEQAQKRGDIEVELVDLKDFNLPFFNEPASDAWMPTSSPEAVAWQNKIAEFDGYIFVVAEYNRSITGALKNALDYAYKGWNRKAAGFIGYGSVGAARAIEHLRNICVELQMVPMRAAVHIGGSDFFKVFPMAGNQPISAIEDVILPSTKEMLDNLAWWSNATKTARAETAAA